MHLDLSARSLDEEIMDDLNCSGEVVHQTLRELEVINKWLGGNQVTIDALKKLLRHHDSDKPIRIADLGCGGGDMLVHILQLAKRKNWSTDLLGIDANPHIIAFARRNIGAYPAIRLEPIDIFSEDFRQQEMDIAIGTLFFHHFHSEVLSDFLARLITQTRIGIIINDIHRHSLAYHSIRLLTKWFSRSAMVKYDAPLSVRRAFTRAEFEKILSDAGIQQYRIQWKWAFRWQVIIYAQPV